MKKNLLWMLAAILTSGLALTSCSVEDNPNPNPVSEPEAASDVVDFEDEDLSVFTVADASKLAFTIVDDEANGTKVGQFVRSGSSGFGYATYQLPDAENATELEVSFDFMIPGEILGQSAITIGDAYVHNADNGGFNTTSGQYGFGTNGAIFYLGAFRGKAYGGGNENYFQINGAPAAASAEEHVAADVWGNWFHVETCIDVLNKTITYSVATADGEVWWSGEDVPFVSENANTATQLSVYVGYSGTYKLDNISVKKLASDASIKYADYTINFVDTEGNALPEDLKPSVTRRDKVGNAIVLLDADKANFTNADGSVKYNYVSDDSEDAVVTEEGTVVTVVYQIEEAAKYKYRLNLRYQYADGSQERITYIDGEQFEGKNVQVGYFASYLNPKDNKFYTTPKQGNYQGRFYTFTGNEDKNSQGVCQVDIYYTETDEYVYIADFEDENLITLVGTTLNQNGASFNGGFFDRFSNGLCLKLAVDSYVYTKPLAGGTYQVYIFGRNDSGSAQAIVALGYVLNGELTKLDIEVPALGTAVTGGVTISNVEIPAGASLAIINDGNASTFSLDLLTVINQSAEETAE